MIIGYLAKIKLCNPTQCLQGVSKVWDFVAKWEHPVGIFKMLTA